MTVRTLPYARSKKQPLRFKMEPHINRSFYFINIDINYLHTRNQLLFQVSQDRTNPVKHLNTFIHQECLLSHGCINIINTATCSVTITVLA